jgi:CHAT domain-containing protein/tetratricopeptide (TPR) repeat protein
MVAPGRPLHQATAESSTPESEYRDLHLLELGKPFDSELSSGQTRSFSISLNSGQCLRVVIDHWGIDVDVAWYGPTGQKITQLPCRRSEPTPFTLIAEASGTYRLEMRAPGEYPAQGRCHVTVQGLRIATSKDKKCVLAEQSAAEAERLRWEWREALSERAIQKYEEALAFWRSAGEKRQETVALRCIGEVYYGLGRSREALKYFLQALEISEGLRDLPEQGKVLSGLASAYHQLDENQKALGYLNRALTLSQRVSDRRMEAQALCILGGIYHFYLGDMSKSLNLYQQALFFWRDLGDLRGQATGLQSLGFAYYVLSDYWKALESFNQALGLWRTVGDRRGQSLSLLGLGWVYSLMGEKQEALNLYGQAKPLFEVMGDHYWEVGVVNGLAYVYDQLGEKQKALEYYEQALRLDRAVGSVEGEASDLSSIGRTYFSLGNKPRALACLQLALKTSTVAGRRILVSVVLRDIGTIYESLGKQREALEYYTRALDLNRKSGGFKREEAITLNDIGYVYWKLGDQQKALDHYKKALSLHRTVMNSFGESVTLYEIAVLERTRGNLAEARSQVEAALKVVESLRGKVASYELRSSYFASERQRYDFYIDLLMQMHKRQPSEGIAADALQASERARARSLVESLSEGRADIRKGINPALLERERLLQQALSAKADRQMRLLGGKPNNEEPEALAKQIRNLTDEYDQVRAEIKSKSPSYAALTQPQPLNLEQIQEQVLDDNSLLLEYVLGDERSYLWAVTKTGMTSHALPKRAEIEKAARHLHELLTAPQPKPGETARQYQARVSEADAQYWPQAAALSQIVLGPVADQLGDKRLLIVAEGALQYLPFGALPVPTGGRGDAETRREAGNARSESVLPLIGEHEIVNLPSASVLAVLRHETGGRKAASKAVAVIADPVFEADDPRLAVKPDTATVVRRDGATGATGKKISGPNASPASPRPRVSVAPRARAVASPARSSELQQALRDVRISRDGISIPRLLSSRQEADAIIEAAAGAGMRATDFKASRATATSPELGQYRIVHFATHGLLNSEHPELSGLVLSLMDEQGKAQNGFLGLHDIYNLNLPVDLVVLSACNTALGKEVRGEGLVGIVRGFMYAGAARVIASLWKVDDEATAELMKHFYQRMLQGGTSPAAALRAAQVEMWQQKRWHSPYYWAAFQLQGEYK